MVMTTTPRPRLGPLLAAPLMALSLGSCTDGGDDDPAVTSTLPATNSPTATPTTPATGSPAPAESDEPTGGEVEFPADRSPDTAPAARTGDGLSVVDVRVGRHEGYDRVVFELDGDGTVGWRVEYDDDPRTQGQGAQVQLAGEATLSILLDGLGYPMDTGIEEYDGPRRFAPGLPAVQEVQLGGVYEGYYDAFVGVSTEQPFRVFRLSDPQRVVLDVVHAG